MTDHTKLYVWQRAHTLAVNVHLAATGIGARTAPGLGAQLKRAAASIPANIAEGAGQANAAQFARFLTIAIASAHEVQNHLALAAALGLINDNAIQMSNEVQEIRKMLFVLRKRVMQRR